MLYSTYLGGNNNSNFSFAIAVDGAGSAYVTGSTASTDFPTTSGAFQTSNGAGFRAFVSKLNPEGTGLIYSTYLGGSGPDDGAASIAIDASGNAYVTGATSSSDFPTTPGAFQTALAGTGDNTFVTKLDPTGSSLVYSTYLGTAGGHGGQGIAVDAGGDAYIAGGASPANFPVTSGALQTSCSAPQCGFVAKLNALGSALVYSTYLSGSNGDINIAEAVKVDQNGNAYVAVTSNSSNLPTTPGCFQAFNAQVFSGDHFPVTGYVAELNASGSALVYGTYLGGTTVNTAVLTEADGDVVSGIAINSAGNATVTGVTDSIDFPTTFDAFQKTLGGASQSAFVTKLGSSGSSLIYSTYLGGTVAPAGVAMPTTIGKAVATDAFEQAFVTGFTTTTDFPTVRPVQTTIRGGTNAFAAIVNTLGGTSASGLVYSTYLGGSVGDNGEGIAIDAAGNIYVTGDTLSPDFPVTSGAFQTVYGSGKEGSGFVTKISPTWRPLVQIVPNAGLFAYGDSVNLTAAVTSPVGSATPTGTVTFYDGTTVLGTATVNGGQAVFTISSLQAGAHSFSASYSGDITFLAVTSATLAQTIAPAPLTITANNATKILNAANPAFTATYSGFVNGDTPDSLSGTLTCTTTTATSPVGSYPINCSGLSSSNYTTTYQPGTLKILYASSGICDGSIGHQILPPINADGSSVYQQSKTVPAKFRVCDANGVSVGTAGVVSSFNLTGILTGTGTITVQNLVDTNNPDNAFHWDPTDLLWIFNISTKNLSAGYTYVYTILLNDGTTINFQYGLR